MNVNMNAHLHAVLLRKGQEADGVVPHARPEQRALQRVEVIHHRSPAGHKRSQQGGRIQEDAPHAAVVACGAAPARGRADVPC